MGYLNPALKNPAKAHKVVFFLRCSVLSKPPIFLPICIDRYSKSSSIFRAAGVNQDLTSRQSVNLRETNWVTTASWMYHSLNKLPHPFPESHYKGVFSQHKRSWGQSGSLGALAGISWMKKVIFWNHKDHSFRWNWPLEHTLESRWIVPLKDRIGGSTCIEKRKKNRLWIPLKSLLDLSI